MLLQHISKVFSVKNCFLCRISYNLRPRKNWSDETPFMKDLSLIRNPRRTLGLTMHHSKYVNVDKTKVLLQKCIDNAMVFDKNSHQSILVSTATIQGFCDHYQNLDAEKRKMVLLHLSNEYGVQHQKVAQSCESFMLNIKAERKDTTLLQAEERLRFQLQPLYNHLFVLIGRLDGGVKFLTDLRGDTIKFAIQPTCSSEEGRKLRDLSGHLKSTLSLWFSVGLLNLTRVTWESSADILEKVAKQEAVHQVRNWVDLKHRLGVNRRCFSFYHSSMPREPLILLHVALTDDITREITDIVDYSRKPPESCEAITSKTTAIFYSITSTQPGLQGIEFGVHIIRAVVQELCKALPNLSQFSSLSPIPRFYHWLMGQISQALKDETALLTHEEMTSLKQFFNVDGDQESMEHLQSVLQDKIWMKDDATCNVLRSPLMRLCAHYLHHVKYRGYAFDPVANFHLRNGAVVWRINWLADPSVKGFQQSFGLMVNYRYYLQEMEGNSRDYIVEKQVHASSKVTELSGTRCHL
ncbi:malonyl-CoA decarboxylase, mitochondrial-like [Clavelina lepadiformis]|uniref:malonyl-CoA decarboxylase, mitochondrial-like n=1 Tax=Clavelina lepadiformis TaxID=159417 RepID=UPI0040412807